MSLILAFIKANPAALGILGLVLGYLGLKFKDLQVDGLKSSLLIATEQKTDAVLAQKQSDIESAIKQAEKPLEHSILTPEEIIKQLDKV
jgi:hypothetical protein